MCGDSLTVYIDVKDNIISDVSYRARGCAISVASASIMSSIIKGKTIEDLENAGWKRGKTYDVNGLTGAKAAYVGFWAPPGLNNLNYEIRVYPDHKSAVEQGAPFAEDASGANASLSSNDALWSEGVRDRRMIVGGGSRGRGVCFRVGKTK